MVPRQSPFIISRSISNIMDTALSNNNNIQIDDISLVYLGHKTQQQLSNLLNREKILRSEEGHERDWRGIARLAQLSDFHFNSSRDPMINVLKKWCETHPKTATIGNLRNYLGLIDRWDVSDDIYENVVKDAQIFHEREKSKQQHTSLNVVMPEATNTDEFDSEENILTCDDTVQAQQGLPLQTYDAFLLFAEQDNMIAIEVIEKIEDQYNFKLYIKSRDLKAGVPFEHVAESLIIDRCRRVIVILTADFLKSNESKFLINLTQMKQIRKNHRKIIPLIYDTALDIPDTLRVYTSLKYQQDATPLYDFWSKLAISLCDTTVNTTALPKNERANITPTPASILNNNNPNTPNIPPSSICHNDQLLATDNGKTSENGKPSKLKKVIKIFSFGKSKEKKKKHKI